MFFKRESRGSGRLYEWTSDYWRSKGLSYRGSGYESVKGGNRRRRIFQCVRISENSTKEYKQRIFDRKED